MIDYVDLPRYWMLHAPERKRTAELESMILQAEAWGFERPDGLTTNAKRIAWLRECRPKAWDMLQPERKGRAASSVAVRSGSFAGLTASQCNAFLATLPPFQEGSS